MTSRKWIRLEVAAPAEFVDVISSFLFDLGSRGLEIEDDETDRAIVIAYFEDEGNANRRLSELHRYLEELDALGIAVRPRGGGRGSSGRHVRSDPQQHPMRRVALYAGRIERMARPGGTDRVLGHPLTAISAVRFDRAVAGAGG